MVFQRPRSAYDDAIRIDANSIDDLFAIRTAYARYYFTTTLRVVREINVAKIDLAGIYQVYFFKSYRGEGEEEDRRTTVGKWVNALWKARGRVGKVATDRVLFIGVTRSALIVSIRDSDSYVRNVVGAGFDALANDNENTFVHRWDPTRICANAE
jgi:hypothetical protein